MDDIEFLVCDLGILWRRAFNLLTKELGISTIERRIIIYVERMPGATQVEIANLLDIEPQNLTKPLDKLIQQKCIEKRQDISDRRVKRLYVTKKCLPMIKKVQEIADHIRPIIMSGMTDKEKQVFLKNAKCMKENLESFLSY